MIIHEQFAYHYYDGNFQEFVNLRSLPYEQAVRIDHKNLFEHEKKPYMNARISVEEMMISIFKKKGGKPRTKYPNYFTVNDYVLFADEFANPRCLKIPISCFDKETISFTYGDSMRTFFDHNHPLQRRLFNLDEIDDIIQRYSLPSQYIEIQLWDDPYQYIDKMVEVQVNKKIEFHELFGKEQIEEYLIYNDYIKAAHYLKPDGVHGINHTKRVLIFCIFLAYLNGIDNQLKHVLYLSAVYHDIGRSIDGTDFLHGEASFNKIEKLGLLKNVSHEQKDYIQYIICNHSIEDSDRLYNGQYRQRDNLLNIFKDADALDRIRLHDFNINYLRNEHSHELTRSAWEVQNMDVDVYVKKHKYS